MSSRQENESTQPIQSNRKLIPSSISFFNVIISSINYTDYLHTGLIILCSFSTGILQAIITLQISLLLGFKISALFDTDSTSLSQFTFTIPTYGILKLLCSLNQSSIGYKISSRIRHNYLSEVLSKPDHRLARSNSYYNGILQRSVDESLFIQKCLSSTIWNIIESFSCLSCLLIILCFFSDTFWILIISSIIIWIITFKFNQKIALIISPPLTWLILNGELLTVPAVIEEREGNEINQGIIFVITIILAQMSVFQLSESATSFIITLNRTNEVIQVLKEYNHHKNTISPTVLPEIKQARIQFINVVFTYPNNTQPSLINFNLTIEPGQTIGLVSDASAEELGQSEAILDLICGKYRPSSGQVLIDDQDPSINQTILKQISSISAYNMDILDGSIYDYVYKGLIGTKYENYNSIDQHRMIMRACKEAGLWSSTKNRSLQSQINGESILSVTERLKLTIARSLVAKPKILLLDQPIALVDSYSQPFISSTLHQISKNRTTILVHYYGSALHLTDRIVILSNGNIMEDSTHHDLLNKSELYRDLTRKWKLSKRRASITESIANSEMIPLESIHYNKNFINLMKSMKGASVTSILLFILFASLGFIALIRVFIGVRSSLTINEISSYKLAYISSLGIISMVELAIYIAAINIWKHSYQNSNQSCSNLINIPFFSTIITGNLILITYLDWKFGLISCLFTIMLFFSGRLKNKIENNISELVIKTYQSKRDQLASMINDKHSVQQFYDSAESDIRRFRRRYMSTKVIYGIAQIFSTFMLTITSLYILNYNVSIAEVLMIHLIIVSLAPLSNGILIPTLNSDFRE